jgi:V-type H+-transporting ATPase subunit E
MCEAEKARLAEKLEKDLNIAEVNMKIKRSAELNTARIDKMRKTNELVESLQLEAKKKMAENLKQNPKSYQELLKNLLVQGLIKLIEPKVILKVRKSDLKIIQGLINDAVKIYKDLMIKQVKALKGKTDIPCEVTVDDKNFLPEWNAEDQKNSCLGGFVIYAKKNRIVCS